MTMSVEDRARRLHPIELRRSAETLLAAGEPIDVVMSLLRTIRQRDDQEESIRVGYTHSIRWERDLHERLIDQEHIEIAKAIEREARRGEASAQGRQQLTYAGGLRRAARIARGWR